jgi:phosphotransferase system enzyme I (PtsI)
MQILKGISAASGIALGPVSLFSSEEKNLIPHYTIDTGDIEKEIYRADSSFKEAQSEMRNMIKNAREVFDRDAADIFHAHLTILEDAEIHKKVYHVILHQKVNAESALESVFAEYIDKYSNLEGHFAELIHDFIDTRNRIIEKLGSKSALALCPADKVRPVIVVADRLIPSLVLELAPENVLAFVSKQGGLTNHATILARSLGVPIVFGVDVGAIDCGTVLAVDGSLGKVIVAPDAKTTEYYARKIESLKKKKLVCVAKKSFPTATNTGKKITLKINISIPEECERAADLGHDGIGLLRTEFLFTQRNYAPTEEEQYSMYKKILDSTRGKPVSARLLDIGADKVPLFLELPANTDPCVGLRGSFAVETFPDLYLTQIKALLRANTGNNLRILYPMISDTNDIQPFRKLINEAKLKLKRAKVPFNREKIPEGVMIETPAAVMSSAELFEEVDFVNIGTNDLLQFALAVSRNTSMTEKRYHILHPALMKYIEIIVREARKAKKEVCLCGEVSSFEEFYPLLIAAGLKSFSVTPSKFDDIKCSIMHIGKDPSGDLLKEYYKLHTREEIDKFFSKFV